ncbi:MAG: calcium-translocating P-type ATPase, PMCA-type [Ruminococcaceae bacterium]|nr:calcium-translocating P-type ATPase, PMCA-type [Oscillospiraceae bacterium]
MVAEKKRQIARDEEVRGLSSAEVEASRLKYGENRMSKRKSRTFIGAFLSNLGDPVIKVLLGALIINILFLFSSGDIYETVGIGISVFLATFISTLSEYGSEAAFEKLNESGEDVKYRVRRDGCIKEITPEEIVVGDILLLSAGEKIPADCILITGELDVDQSAMTGEGKEVHKRPFVGSEPTSPALEPSLSYALLGGCVIVSGEGVARVAVVGDSTFLGGISSEIQMQTRESPLRIRLTKLAATISKLGYIAAALVAFAYLINSFILDSGLHPALILMKLGDVHYLFSKLLHAFTLGLTVIVVAVPEGLPMMIAVVLSANIKRMTKDNVLVRKPVGIEAAGSMNILFTDKTGTLTEGKLTVKEYILGDGTLVSPLGKVQKSGIMRLFALSGIFNTSSVLTREKKGRVTAFGGNMTDRALTESASPYFPEFERVEVLRRMPFDSDKKISAVRLGGAEKRVLIKGAPERLLPFVRACYLEDGRKATFNLVRFERHISSITSSGGRVVLIAESDSMPGEGKMSLTLIGAAHLSDRIRKEAADSVSRLQSAGVHVVMVTGDNIETARSIAEQCGLIGGDVDICITSSELAKLGDVKLRSLLPRIGVVARALPSDKSRLVRVAQEAEMVVGMTGDGINDAPALKRADIGFAMGNGTQVAKEAGDIIILDNNLSSIAKAVLYGRGIFKNIRKFITLQLTMNLCAVGISMIGPFIGFDAPVTVVQMLWINIIMDTLGGLAFAGEHAPEEYMKEKPKKRDEAILNRYMAGEILTMGGFTVALCLAFLKLPAITRFFRYDSENIYLLTAFFALFIFSSVFNCFCARTDSLNIFRWLSKNKVFIFIMLLITVIQVVFIYLGGSVLRTAPLTFPELRATLVLALSVFPVDFLRKTILRLLGSKNRSY